MTNLETKVKGLAGAAILALGSLLLSACGQESPEKLLGSAKQYLANGDRNAAVIQLKNLLNVAPNNGEGRLLLGQALLESEDFASAEKELSRALELKQPQERVLPLYAQALFAQGKYKEAIAEVGKYRLYDPAAIAATQSVVGDAQMRLGGASQAKEAFAAAMAAVPGYPRARLGMAMLSVFEGRLDEALSEVDAIIAANAKLADARAFRADILLAKGDREGAKKALQDAIVADDRYLPARLGLIDLLINERDYAAAAALVATTRKVAPRDIRVIHFDALTAFLQGEVDRSRQLAQEVLRFVPDYVPSLVLAGAVALRDKQYTLAQDHLRKALGRAPNHGGARQLLVQAYLRAGQPAKAKEVLQPLVDRGIPNDVQWQMLAGETFLANGDVKRATAFYQAAAKSSAARGDEQRIAARTRLGQIALATGKVDEGFKELEAVSELGAGAYQADLVLIAGHLSRNEIDKAMSAVQALEKKQPNNPMTFQMYGIVHIAKRDLDAARRSFEKALEFEPSYLAAAQSLAKLDLVAKRPDDARKRYEAMIAKSPNNEQLYLALADLQNRSGASGKEIASTLQRAVAANPQSSAARLGLIQLSLLAQDFKGALAAAQGAVAALPNDPAILDAAGVAQESAGEFNQAIETYNKLAALQPQAPQPRLRLASLYIRQGDTDKAIDSLRRVQKIAPRERDVYPYLVQVYLLSQRYDDARREAQELQKREPKFAGGYSLEGDVYFAERKFADAERAYRQALRVEPRANVVAVKVHAALAAAGKSAEAEAWAKKWIADNPKDAAMRLHIADQQLAAKDLKSAAAQYRAVIAIEPNNAAALNNLAWIGGETGDPKSLGYAERALKLAPSNVAVLDTYAMLLVKSGETPRALPYLERATKLAPGRHDLRMNYARALIKAGQKEDARKQLETLQAAKDQFPGKDEIAALLKGL